MKDKSDQLIDPIKCKDCANGHFIAPCRAAKIDHNLLRDVCDEIRGKHNPEFFCGYAIRKEE